jgi:hypothetical protein
MGGVYAFPSNGSILLVQSCGGGDGATVGVKSKLSSRCVLVAVRVPSIFFSHWWAWLIFKESDTRLKARLFRILCAGLCKSNQEQDRLQIRNYSVIDSGKIIMCYEIPIKLSSNSVFLLPMQPSS